MKITLCSWKPIILLALTQWNLNRFSQFFHCWKKKKNLNKTTTNWKTSSDVAESASCERCSSPQSALVHVCRLLKHFSCRCFCMMRTTDDVGMPVPRDISRTVLWVRGWSSWLRIISFTWSMFSSMRARRYVISVIFRQWYQTTKHRSPLKFLFLTKVSGRGWTKTSSLNNFWSCLIQLSQLCQLYCIKCNCSILHL